jgi:uncharacterized protein (DUF697 family)
MALPLDLRDLMSAGTKLRAEREKQVRIAVYVDADAPEAAVDALKEALRPQMSTARLHVEPVLPGDVYVVDDLADAVVALAGPSESLAPSLARARETFTPTALLVLGETRDGASRRLGHPLLDTLTGDTPDELVAHLGKWFTDRVDGKRVALAANFDFIRRAVAEEAVKNTAFQNGVIGGVAIIPGADMPLMTVNQAKMVLQIAAAYGQPLDATRIKELAAVVGGAFAMRTIARQVLTLVPGFGWAIKAGIGYSGTLAMGYATIEYFEGGGDAAGLGRRLAEARDKVLTRARGERSSVEPIPAHAWVVEGAETPGPLPVLEAAPSQPVTPESTTEPVDSEAL